MFDIRRRLEAEGERRMIGSDRLELTADERGFDGAGAGRDGIFVFDWPGRACDGSLLRRPRKVSACLRTCEKS